MNDPDELDLADDELRDSRGRSHEDHEADEADRKRKIEREDGGEYESWSRRLELEAQAAYERDKRLFTPPAKRWDW